MSEIPVEQQSTEQIQLDEFERALVSRWDVMREAQRVLIDTMQKTMIDEIAGILRDMLNQRRQMIASVNQALEMARSQQEPDPESAPKSDKTNGAHSRAGAGAA